MKNKIFSLLFAVMAGTVFSYAAVVDGACGNNLTWSLNTKDSTLTIEGTGEMTSTPWSEYVAYVAYIVMQEGLTSIASSAFSACSKVTSIAIPSSVTSIGSGAFSGCSGIKSITIPNGITIINDNTFSGCTGLKSVEIPNSVNSIGSDAFYYCTSMQSVTIGGNLTNINGRSFLWCSSLNKIYYTGTMKDWCSKSWSPRDIIDQQGSWYLYLDGVLVSDLVLTEDVSVIAKNAFAGCSNLKSVIIPNSVTSIGKSAFTGCSNLQSVTIPNSINSIGASAFNNCKSITSLTIPGSVTSIGEGAFSGCTGLNMLTCNAVTPPAGGAQCGLSNTTCALFVPKESVETYANSIWWEDFKAVVAIGTKYAVKFVDWNGTLLKVDSVGYGEAATAPANPVREGYTFMGWSLKFNEVTSNLVVTARYMDGEIDLVSLNFEITYETTELPQGYVYSANTTPIISSEYGFPSIALTQSGSSTAPTFNDPAEPSGGKRWMAFRPQYDCNAVFYVKSDKKTIYIHNKEGVIFSYPCLTKEAEEIEVTGLKKGVWYAISGSGSKVFIQKAEFYPTCTATEQRLQLKADKTEIFVDDEVTFSTEGGNGAIVIIDGTKDETIVNNKWIATAGMHTFIATQEDKDGICGNVLELTLTVVDNSPVTSAVISGESIVEVNQKTTLTCSAPNATSFQWYMNGVLIGGATDPTYTFTPSEEGELRFVCEATNKFTESPVKSEVFRVLVAEAEPTPEPQSCGLLVKVQATGYRTTELSGTFTGVSSADLSSKDTEKSEYEGEVGYKLNSAGKYLGVTFDEGYVLKEGDKVTVFVTTTSPKMQIFADKEGTTLLAEADTVVLGENVFYLDERANGAQGIYVCRVLGGTEGAQYNAFVAYISVERACVEEGYFQVVFKDWDGSVLSSESVKSGEAATAPKDPVREGYTFTGWDKDFSAVTEAMTITAQYQINTYTVVFVDWDDTVLKTEKVNFNEPATAPADPSREWYTFIGWDQDFSAVTSNMVVRALYSEGQTNVYTVRFTSSTNNSEISTGRVQIDMPVPPTFEGFTFLRWEMKAGELIDVIEIQAIYKANEPTSAPEVYTNPSNPAQKLVRNGNVYILREDKTYTITGQAVK